MEAAEDGTFRLHVTSPPVDGAANKKVIELVSQHYKVPKGSVSILRGDKSSTKHIEIQTS
jgi:uncharacterized protein (TIGR00251 family)